MSDVWATVIVVSEGWRVLFLSCGLCVLFGIRLQAGKEVKRNRAACERLKARVQG